MPLADSLACLAHLLRAVPCLAADAARLIVLAAMPSAELAARVLLVEKELAMFKERAVKPRRARPAERVTIALLIRLVADWRDHLLAVTPDTVCRWHRLLASWLWWRRSQRRGRPPLPCEIRVVIGRIAADCPTWSPRRIRDEARLKLDVRVAEATVR